MTMNEVLTVNLEAARQIIRGAESKARSLGCAMNIAVVDAGGNLVAHVRMDNARIGAIDIAINKASSAPSASVAARMRRTPPAREPRPMR
jgi:uncharacterized protein GlcG (DUF336 family)